ncbi:MAG: YbgC/FadM family acyl-CoA thioesterase [Gammaproteobacteria bacterium]|nr:YbgC/FadM family acyl-CoA thioesterase [Gammaproteobacteria bacterium]MBU0788684.1 YbgC/FadM family acyl-CoA thioesterase [Gammaproteobacteria bacterium]MBU0814697.1 YbgC/FadM family acyl-CoA thioesterase [Gammaproteobacteria bacterium]MBU1786460.1 YbgC/FadM family acyl-CoA thioesterase [Gammaproteobacteria bacterium]
MTRRDFRFFHRLRVRWAEVDMQKIVFNAHYLMYLDTAIADYWRALALPYEASMHELSGDLYVKKATLEYHASARYDEQLDIGLKCARIGNSSILFLGGIFHAEELLVSGELLYVFADPLSQTSAPVPASLRELLLGYEAGESVLRVQTGPWHELKDGARQVRTEVFLKEQRIPLEMEWDEADESAVHAVAYNRLDMPVGTGRLLQHAPGIARIGRMAVSRALRGGGLGRSILQALMQAAAARGDHEVMLHAQRSAEGFYRGLGFEPRGDAFDEAGIPHIEMFCHLTPGQA